MKAQTATVASGLVAVDGHPVPLVGVAVEAEIRDYSARVVLIQRYRNDESEPIEAVYKFPLDDAAAVCGFEATIDGRRVVAHVEEREKAFKTYDEALAAGHGGYLLDEERPDIFTVSVGNIAPGKEVVLRVTTVSELALEGEDIRFTLPTTISPRYAPAEDVRGVGIPEAERVTPPYALAVPYGLTLKVDVETSAAIRKVASPTHPVEVSIEDRHAVVALSSRETAMDRDFVLKVTMAEDHQPRVLAERTPDGKTCMLVSFRPKLDAGFAPSEVVFLVDRSGSMQGTSITEAGNALTLALRTLRPGCFFNIVGFGSTHSALFPESRPYGDDALAAASAYIHSMDANMGGTDILPALEFVFSAKATKGLARQVFVLTDGEVSNTEEVIELARRHGGQTRVFTFGIGAAPSHHLVKGLARAGEGEAEFIMPGERVEAKVLRQLNRALSAALTEVRVDWGGLDVEQAPYVLPPVFADGRVLVFGRMKERKAATVTLRGRSSQGEVAFSLPIEPSAVREGTLVSTLWARRAIRDLEEGCSALHLRRGSRQERAAAGLDEQVKAEIVRLGVDHGLLSRHTSFVAVEERENPVEGELRVRKVPVAISRGWHGVGSLQGVRGLARMTAAPSMSYSVLMRESPQAVFDACGDVPLRARRAGARKAAPGRRPVDRVVALQGADGSWDLTEEFAKAVGIGRRELDREFDDLMMRLRAGTKSVVAAAALATECQRSVRFLFERLGELRPILRSDSLAIEGSLRQLAAEIDQVGEAVARPSHELEEKLDELVNRLHRLPAAHGDEALCRRAFATALALRWLEERCADTRGEWEGLAQKAQWWLQQAPQTAGFWLDAASKSELLASRPAAG